MIAFDPTNGDEGDDQWAVELGQAISTRLFQVRMDREGCAATFGRSTLAKPRTSSGRTLVIDTIHERQTGLGCLVWLEYAINSWKPYCRPGPGTALLWRPICNTILPQGVEQEELRPGDGAAGLFGSNEEAAELRLAGLERWSWGDYHFPDKNCGWLEAWRARAEFIRNSWPFPITVKKFRRNTRLSTGGDQGVFHAANRGRIEEWKQEVRDTLEEDLRAEEVMNELFRNSRN